MLGWQNVELFTFLPSERFRYYGLILANWLEEFKFCPVLMVPTSPVLAYYCDLALLDHEGAQVIWHITITEYVVMT